MMEVSQENESQGTKRDHDSFLDDLMPNKPFTADSQYKGYQPSQEEEIIYPEKAMESVVDEPTASMPTPTSVGNLRDMDSSRTAQHDTPTKIPSQREKSPTRNAQDDTPTSIQMSREPSSVRSRSSSLSAIGSVTPSPRASPAPGAAPSAFAQMNGSTQSPAKKVKLPFAEKEMERINKEIKARERAEAKAKKDAEKAKKEADRLANAADKAQKEAEKAEKKRKQDAEKEEKRIAAEEKKAAQEAEKAAKEEKKRQKEEEKRKKDEEKQKADEEKRKKEKSQKKLNSFFVIPPSTARRGSADAGRTSASPGPSTQESTVPAALTPSKPQLSYYDKTFPPFFVQNHVRLAPINRFVRDERASESIHSTIDSYISGNQSHHVSGRRRDIDVMSIFHIRDQRRRGKQVIPVREIMTEFSGKSTQPIDLTSDSQNSQIKRSIDLLKEAPMKFLKFQEDVRPPYRGTYTSLPVHGIANLAKNPMRKDLPDKNYDYDSEAEWVEDEDAEDLNSEDEDDEEDDEDDENLKQFLDDENDELAHSKRMVIQGDLEPVSTGLCWEDKHKKSTNVKMVKYRMEVILDGVKSIDPFTARYWQPPPTLKKMEPPRRPLDALAPPNTLPQETKISKPPVPTDFFAPVSSKPLPSIELPSTQPGGKKGKEHKALEGEQLKTFKLTIQENNDLNKLGLTEILKKKFHGDRGITADIIKHTLDQVARREGKKLAEKRWVLIEDTPRTNKATNELGDQTNQTNRIERAAKGLSLGDQPMSGT